MILYFVNESSLSDRKAWQIAWACDYQAQYHYGRSGWRSDVRCLFLPGGVNAKVPVGGRIIHLIDNADQPGALGYHDEDGNEVPFGRVFVQTALQAGAQVSEVASHEALELATDEHVNDSCLSGDMTRLYAKETGDACQGNAYDLGAPNGRVTGFVVADFNLPGYFDPKTPADVATDFVGALKGPFALGPQGYYSYVDLANVSAGWQQAVGHERTAPPPVDVDDRVRRRVAAVTG